MPMIAIMAMQPFDTSAANLFFSNARIGESEYEAQSTSGAVRQVVLDERAGDRHQGQAAVRQLGCHSSSRTCAAASPSTRPDRPQALPVQSTVVNLPMITIVAKQPFATSAATIFESTALSGESEYRAPSTPGAAHQVVHDEPADDRHHGQSAAGSRSPTQLPTV